IGQLLNRFFDAAERGDDEALAKAAHDYAQTPQFQEWDQWGQESYRQWQRDQQRKQEQEQEQQLAQQEKPPSIGRGL
ncbi:MAG: hypothetical protein LBL59_06705, partial [Xanthomonadaceae bacterium]|nr:hypothetical protein [Xanthomonadaceae bacterium]